MLFDDSLVYIGTDVPSGHVYAFEKKSGKVRWRYFAGLGVCGDIVGFGDRLFALTKEDTLLCLERDTGGVIWKFHTDAVSETSNDSSPCLSGDRIYIRDMNYCVYALSAISGDLIWKAAIPDYLTTSVAFWHKGIYVGSKDRKVYRLSAETGRIEAVLSLPDVPYGKIACAGEHLVLFTGQRNQGSMLVSFEPGLSKIHWKREAAEDTGWTTYRIHIWNDDVVVGDGLGNVVAFRIADGARSWSIDVRGVVKTIARSGDRLFVGTLQGMLYSFRIKRESG